MQKTKLTLILVILFLAQNYSFAQCWNKIETGGSATLAIKTDGTLWAQGLNDTGQIGDGTTISKIDFIQIGNANDWLDIGSGDFFSVAIKTDGTLWAWGRNGAGQIGDGTRVNKLIPTQIGSATWKQVSARGGSVLALKTDGTLWAWGSNHAGQLGDGTKDDKLIPIQIGVSNDWKQVSASNEHSVAIKTDGTLWAWGDNFAGQLGDNTLTNKERLAPSKIGTANDWQQISTGYHYTIALKTDGTLWACGLNAFNQLGDGTKVNKSTLIQIGTANNWKSIYAGSSACHATKTDGTLWGWGDNSAGYVGDGNTENRSIPIQIGTANNWKYISDGNLIYAAIKSDGTLWVWGSFGGYFGFNNSILSPVYIPCTSVTVDDKNEKLIIRIYPNPAYSNSISVTIKKDSKYELIDVIGNIVQYGNLVEGENVVDFTESLQNGSYFLRINNTIQKLIIRR